MPFRITSGWTGIMRTIVPLNTVPASDATRQSGVGDIQAQLFLTPARPGKVIWGVGPMFSLPTATMGAARNRQLGHGTRIRRL